MGAVARPHGDNFCRIRGPGEVAVIAVAGSAVLAHGNFFIGAACSEKKFPVAGESFPFSIGGDGGELATAPESWPVGGLGCGSDGFAGDSGLSCCGLFVAGDGIDGEESVLAIGQIDSVPEFIVAV